MFRHPKYYKELRKRNKEAVAKSGISSHASLETDQAISSRKTVDVGDSVRPGPGLKLQAREDSTVNRVAEPQASSAKLTDPQATSDKHQAPRHKRQA